VRRYMVINYFLSVSNLVQASFQQRSQEVVVEIPARIELSVGETYTLKLPGLGTAGYLWTHEVIENSNLIDVSVATARISQSSNEGTPPMVGSSVDEIFTLKAQRVGHASIRFVQRRSWEQNQPPLKEHILEVDIHD
jgi:predicted secreted protein